MSRIDEVRDFCFFGRVCPMVPRPTVRIGETTMNCWMTIGLIWGVCLLIAAAAVALECAYDAGFEDGFAHGRACGKEAAK